MEKMVSTQCLLPARADLEDYFHRYDLNDDHNLSVGVEISELRRHITRALGNETDADDVLNQSDIDKDGGVDLVEFGVLLDLMAWKLNLDIKTNIAEHRFQCRGNGKVGLNMGNESSEFSDPASISQAHIDLDAAFTCFDINNDGQLQDDELKELKATLKKSLHFSNVAVEEILKASHWFKAGYGRVQFDTLLLMLKRDIEKANVGVRVRGKPLEEDGQ